MVPKNVSISGYFDIAEINAIEHKPMYMADYVAQLDAVLVSGNRKMLKDAGKISHSTAIEKASKEYRKFQAEQLSSVEKEYLDTVKNFRKKQNQKQKKYE